MPSTALEPGALDLGHLPLVRAALDALGIVKTIDEAIPPDPRSKVTHGECVAAMVLNVLDDRVALYAMAEALADKDVELLLGPDRPVSAFSDDRLAKTLDALFEAGTDDVFTQVVLRQVRQPGFPKEHVLHADTTTFVLEGAYEAEPEPGAPRPAHGHSKDFRPDAKQLVYGLTVHGGAGIPIRGRMMDGNASDAAFNRPNVDAIRAMLPPADEATLVADCKLVDAKTLGRASLSGLHYLARLPRSFAAHDALILVARSAGLPFEEILVVPGRKRADPPKTYRATSLTHELELADEASGRRWKKEHRFLVVESSRLLHEFEAALPRRTAEEADEARRAAARSVARPFRSAEDAEESARRLREGATLHRFDVGVERVEVPIKRGRAGRPPKGAPPPTEPGWVLVLRSIGVDEDELQRARWLASHFVLVTDHPRSEKWPDERVLKEYRAQGRVEGASGFRWLKDVARVAPVFLKTPSRIAALGLVFLLALMVRNWIEATVRAGLKESGGTLPNMIGRPTPRPTTENVAKLFRGLKTGVLRRGGAVIQRFPPTLSDDARAALAALGFSEAIFREPPRNWGGTWWTSS